MHYVKVCIPVFRTSCWNVSSWLQGLLFVYGCLASHPVIHVAIPPRFGAAVYVLSVLFSNNVLSDFLCCWLIRDPSDSLIFSPLFYSFLERVFLSLESGMYLFDISGKFGEMVRTWECHTLRTAAVHCHCHIMFTTVVLMRNRMKVKLFDLNWIKLLYYDCFSSRLIYRQGFIIFNTFTCLT